MTRIPAKSLSYILPIVCFGLLLNEAARAQQITAPKLSGAWKRNGLALAKFTISGTGGRNNPLRQKLEKPFAGNQLFFRFRMRYAAGTIDQVPVGDGEFFVFWLDDQEGGDGSTHSNHIPNLGIHTAGDANRFMVRYGPNSQKFAGKLVGDRDTLLVGRLSKSVFGGDESFDKLEIWVDPQAGDFEKPHAITRSKKSLSRVSWVGFSTGVKTEVDDEITVWDVDVSESWQGILGLPESPFAPRLTQRTVRFDQHVLPILKSRCFGCHAGADAESGIRLDVFDEVLNKTTPRNAGKSELYRLAASGKMPPDGDKLDEAELSVIRAWIDEGLDWNEALLPTPAPTTGHWAFQPIRRPRVPVVKNQDWVKTPVDAFIAKRHEELGLQPAPPASLNVLDRRLCLDLLGLPVSEVDIEHPSEHVDQLLSSPAYGERWGRHWLDVARWAESNGHQHNRDRKHAWRYRDWVVNAFQSNKPFDEFVREQIAGDLISPPDDDKLIATGFLAAASYSGNELDKAIQRNDILTDVANTTASAFLGLTMECAQCHTHKFDPISLRDYYRFQAFFAKGQPANLVLRNNSHESAKVIGERWRIFESVEAKLVAARKRQGIANPVVIPKTVLAAIKGEQRKHFQALEKQIQELDQTWAWQSAGGFFQPAPHDMRFPLPYDPDELRARETYLLIRGDVKTPGPVVEPGWPIVFGRTPDILEQPRLQLADWLTSPKNPLTARVWVNRIWQWHFGRGLVKTSGDFGTQGKPPSHPELLDFLAVELMENEWNTNHIHRLIVGSATYRQSAKFSETNAQIDPGNTAYWRWVPRRLEAEAIRDSVLAVSGQLDSKTAGPSMAENSQRRSVYLKQRRQQLPYQQELFDSANGIASCSRRRTSTTPLQPLWLLNSPFMQAAAKQFAGNSENIEAAFRRALNREPTPSERQVMQNVKDHHGLEAVCLVILNLSEFLYLN